MGSATVPIVIHEGGGVTLLIASLGFGLSMAALTWQAASFFLSGPRIKVYLREGFRAFSGATMWAPSSAYTDEGRASLARQGFTEDVIGIEVVNRGRLAGTVTGWELIFANGSVSYSNPSDLRNRKLPYRLEPHSSEFWISPRAILEATQELLSDQSDAAAHIRGQVILASRKAIKSKNSIVVRRQTDSPGPEIS